MSRLDVSASRGMRRLRVGLGVLVFSLLAVVLVGVLLGLSEQPGLRWRVDLSEVRRNSLDASTEDLLGRLDEDVTAHVFFRSENSWRDLALEDARTRMLDVLLVASKLAPEHFDLELHDLGDLAAAGAEMQRLGVDRVNTIVLEEGPRHVLLRLEPDICSLGPDPANPQRFKVVDFQGEQALVDGLLKVSAANQPKVYFSTGHGELALESDEPGGLSRLMRALGGDGFQISEWNAALNGPLADDVDVLAIVVPKDPFAPDELRLVEDFVARGGRLFVVLGESPMSGPGSPDQLLRGYGLLSKAGLVCIPALSQDLGQMSYDIPACAEFQVEQAGLNSSHPITKPIWAAARKVAILRSRSFERGMPPQGGSLVSLLTQRNRYTWLDLPDARGRYDYRWDMAGEPLESASLAMAAEFPGGAREARVVGLASSSIAVNALFEANRDFLMNSFNWLAEREFNLRVALRPDRRTMIDVVRGTEIIWLRRIAWYGLPGSLALIGLLLAWRRRRG